MTKVRAVSILLVLTLTGCNWFSSPKNPPVTSTGTATAQPTNPACACDEFPFPKACESACETGDVTIESVDAQTRTAEVKIVRGAHSTNQTVPLGQLPAGIAAEKGANFTALFQKSAASTQNLRIIRLIKPVSDLKIPPPAH
jgi:hypothetical protein